MIKFSVLSQKILKKLREWYQKAVIILSVRDSEEDIIKALDNGAKFIVAQGQSVDSAAGQLHIIEKLEAFEETPDLQVDNINWAGS